MIGNSAYLTLIFFIMENTNYDSNWSGKTAWWVIAAVILIAVVVWVWQRNCSEKTLIATNLAKLDGRIDAIEPAVTAQGNNLFALNGVVSATVQGAKGMAEQIYQLNDEIFYHPIRRSGCGCGCGNNREFKQTSTYNLASTNVTVDETCRN